MPDITINGSPVAFAADPATPLLTVLRDDLGLYGAKPACGLEQCGACMVLIDGEAHPSCRVPVGEVAGKRIRTIEGLAFVGALHPVQQAFVEEQALQCGFCTSGFVVAAAALLDRNPHPGDDEIRAALDRNLCRCGVYPRVLRAVRRAAGRPDEPAITVVDRPLEDAPVGSKQIPSSFERSPNLDDWFSLSKGSVGLHVGKVEYGQGILTALAQIAADELDVNLDRMRVVTAHTGGIPNEGMTVGSMSLMTTGVAIRIAAASARQYLLSLALEELEARPENLYVEDGTVIDRPSGRRIAYWDLIDFFDAPVNPRAPLKAAVSYQVVGASEKRLDLQHKLTGDPHFLHDLNYPVDRMLHGRVLRPPRPGARLVVLDEAAVAALPGVVRVVRDGSFAGVIATMDLYAARAVERMRESARWDGGLDLPGGTDQRAYLESLPAQSTLVVDGTPVEGEVPPGETPAEAARTLTAEYFRPFQMHASLAPSAAVAYWGQDGLSIDVHAQGVYPLRRQLAWVLGMDESEILVMHREGSGVYGHNGADDAALDAALLARACPDEYIMLKWSRADEHTWEPYAPAMLVKMQGSLDEIGRIVAWDHQVRSYQHMGRSREGEGVSGLLASWTLDPPFSPPPPEPSFWNHAGGYRNADPLYALPNKRIVHHFVPDSPLRTSSMRGLGAFANVFAIESFMDELALAAVEDPLAFRLGYLQDPRAREVLEAAAGLAGWQPAARPRGDGTGRGLAFARYKNNAAYCAVVIDVSGDSGGRIRLERAWIAADAGQIVNPDGLANQLEGGLVQAASWTLKEQVRYGPEGIESVDWETYPILRFSEAPEIRTVLLNRPGAPFLGSGEASCGPAGAAIANAVFDATGKRLRDLPLSLPGNSGALPSMRETFVGE